MALGLGREADSIHRADGASPLSCPLSDDVWLKINELIPVIYLEPDLQVLRLSVLEALEGLIPHDKSFFDLGYKHNNKVTFFDPASRSMEHRWMDAYFNEYEAVDTMFWFFSQDQNNLYRGSDYINDAMMNSSVYYREWMAPQNLRYSMGSKVEKNGILYGSVNLWRSAEAGDFQQEELFILDVINRHLSERFYARYPSGIQGHDDQKDSNPNALCYLYGLTQREGEVVECITAGLTGKEIAESLFISENTVKKHTYNIFKKMNVNNRHQLMRIVHSFSTTNIGRLSEDETF